MSKKNNIQNQEALDAFYFAVRELTDNASSTDLEYVYELFQNIVTTDVDLQHDYMSASIQSLPLTYLDLIATDIVNDLIDNPIFYVTQHLPFYNLMNKRQADYLNLKVIEIGWGTAAAAIYKALDSMELGSHKNALTHLNGLENHLYAKYLKGLCFIENEEPENAMRHFEQLHKDLINLEKKFLELDYHLEEEVSYQLFILDIHMSLLGLYAQLKYFKKASATGDLLLEEFGLEILSIVFKAQNTLHNHSDYEFYCLNYAHAIAQVHGPQDAMKFMNRAMDYGNGSMPLAMANGEYMKRAAFHDEADAILKPLRPVKRATSVTTFSKTSRFAREKHLEDMMIEHIKYGYEIFNRQLELYEDDHFIGRQYRLKTDRHILDLLLIEKSTDTLYIVELKRNKAGKEVYEQTRTYVELLRKETNKKVKGIICLHEFNQELVELVKEDQDIELFTYNFNFKKQA